MKSRKGEKYGGWKITVGERYGGWTITVREQYMDGKYLGWMI